MNTATKIALAKLLAKQTADLDLPVGKTSVDEVVTIHVQADLSRSKDGSYTQTVSIPLKATMALLLARMGFQRDEASKLIQAAMRDALQGNAIADEAILARINDVDTAMEAVQANLDAMPKGTRKGAMKVVGSVQFVEAAEPSSLLVA